MPDGAVARGDSNPKPQGDDVMSEQSLQRQVAELERRLGPPLSEEARTEFVSAQARADCIAQGFGDSAPSWVGGENLLQYRRRLLGLFKQHNKDWKNKDLSRVDASVLDIAETQIYAAAQREASAPTNVAAGQLVERYETDRTGRRISKFYGDPEVTWSQFKAPVRYVVGFNIDGKK
jgi:hypothetical protein